MGKCAVIVDIVDQSRALIDGPTTGVKRQVLNFRRMQLTDIVVKIPRAVGTTALKRHLEKEELNQKFEKTPWAKKQAIRAKRAAMNDFDRFKYMLAKKEVRITRLESINHTTLLASLHCLPRSQEDQEAKVRINSLSLSSCITGQAVSSFV